MQLVITTKSGLVILILKNKVIHVCEQDVLILHKYLIALMDHVVDVLLELGKFVMVAVLGLVILILKNKVIPVYELNVMILENYLQKRTGSNVGIVPLTENVMVGMILLVLVVMRKSLRHTKNVKKCAQVRKKLVVPEYLVSDAQITRNVMEVAIVYV